MGLDFDLTIVDNGCTMTPTQLKHKLKTQQAIAEFFDVSPTAVSKWFKSGKLPKGRIYEAKVRLISTSKDIPDSPKRKGRI